MAASIHPISLGMVKVFLIEADGKLVLVDTGMNAEHVKMILGEIHKLGKQPKDVELCIVTHRHGDHVGGLKALKASCGFKVASHEDEASKISEATGVSVDLKLKDGAILPYAGGIRAVSVPGHTTGNITLYIPELKAVLVGDTMFGDEKGSLSPPPEKYCDDVRMAEKEIQRLLRLDFDTVYLSHGKDIMSGGKEKVKALVSK